MTDESRERIERVLAGAPGQAQPSEIVAAEIAFARAARENGQWTAFREFLAPGALLHVRSGPIEADPWLAVQTDPPEAVQWGARSVWMSCDGALAVSQGRFREPDGTVGTFVTVCNGKVVRVRDGAGNSRTWQPQLNTVTVRSPGGAPMVLGFDGR